MSETKTITYNGNGTDTLGTLLASAANSAISYLAGLDSDEFVILTNVIVNSSNVAPYLTRFTSTSTFNTYFGRLSARNAQTSIGIITGYIGASGSQMITSSIDSGLTISSFTDRTDTVPSTSIVVCQLVFERYTPL